MLVLALVVGICPATLAAESAEKNMLQDVVEMDADEVSQEIIDEFYTLTDEEVNAILAANDDTSDTAAVSTNAPDTMSGDTERVVTATYGPYSNIKTMPSRYLAIMLQNIIDNPGGNFFPVAYNGKDCYLFTEGSTNVYVTASAFTVEQDWNAYPSDVSVSSSVTTYVNNKNTDAVCSTYLDCRSPGDSTYHWSIAQIATQAYPFNTYEMRVKNSILYSVSFVASPTYLTVYSLKEPSISLQPELSLEMTNTGSNNAYFDAFEVVGKGNSTNTLNVSSLIKLGYNTALIATGQLSKGTLKGVLDATLSLVRSKSGSRYNYSCESVPVTNPSKKVWSRQCSMQTTFKLVHVGDFYEMKVGLESISSTVKYKVTVRYNF